MAFDPKEDPRTYYMRYLKAVEIVTWFMLETQDEAIQAKEGTMRKRMLTHFGNELCKIRNQIIETCEDLRYEVVQD